ncbi:unnamed protein product [Soboliphyme baturini]|uniref:Coiled-coil domain-containing protein 39 n=1 Tax=Soboliphyme baturini TaxID=241478 RepID=A0A183IU61_9BILA|nr:unnamed protein product [Soboliphyme baturini]
MDRPLGNGRKNPGESAALQHYRTEFNTLCIRHASLRKQLLEAEEKTAELNDQHSRKITSLQQDFEQQKMMLMARIKQLSKTVDEYRLKAGENLSLKEQVRIMSEEIYQKHMPNSASLSQALLREQIKVRSLEMDHQLALKNLQDNISELQRTNEGKDFEIKQLTDENKSLSRRCAEAEERLQTIKRTAKARERDLEEKLVHLQVCWDATKEELKENLIEKDRQIQRLTKTVNTFDVDSAKLKDWENSRKEMEMKAKRNRAALRTEFNTLRGSLHTHVLLHVEVRLLSRNKVVTRLLNLRQEVRLFFQQQIIPSSMISCPTMIG